MMIVLDSSAMLAYLRGETGGVVIRNLLAEDVDVCAHATNLCEVYYDFLRGSDVATAENAIKCLKADGIIERNDMDSTFWRDVAMVIGTQRKLGNRIALGDAFGIALARRENAKFYTSDRGELASVHERGLCQIEFIR